MILTLLSIGLWNQVNRHSTVIEDTSVKAIPPTIDPCEPIEGLDGLSMSGSIVFEDGIQA